MATVDRYPAGSFCWVELGTQDLERAKAFYGELFGWRFEELAAGGEPYTLAQRDGFDVAGLDQHHGRDVGGWQSYLAVDDMDATIAAAQAAGAEIVPHAGDLPFASRFAALRIGGSTVVLWQLEPHHGARLVNEIGTWNWNELVTPDLDAVAATYAAVMGWTVDPVRGVAGRITFRKDGRLIGGGHAPIGGESAEPRWEVSFRVADADDAAARVEAMGGSILLPPLDIPIGRFTIVADPDGAVMDLSQFEHVSGGVDGS